MQTKLSRRLMGGTFSVLAWTNSAHEAERVARVIGEGFDLVAELEDRLTDFRDSPFNEINRAAGKHAVVVDAETFALVEEAQRIAHRTGGAFDISYASVGQLWRRARQTGVLPDPAAIEAQRRFVDYRQIQLDPQARSVYLPFADMRIGLGGIGKGYAVDKLFAFLQGQGVVNFLVDGAGDLRVHSEKTSPRPWRLHVRNPFALDAKKSMGLVQLASGAMATSGDYVNYVKSTADLERKFHHIIDPKLGYPTNEIVSCTVLAPTALEADTVATSVIVMNLRRGLDYLNTNSLTGFVVTKDGAVHLSARAFELMQKGVPCADLSSSASSSSPGSASPSP